MTATPAQNAADCRQYKSFYDTELPFQLVKLSANNELLCSARPAGLSPSGAMQLVQGQAPSQAKLRIPAFTAPSPAELAQAQMKQQAKENMKAAYTMVARINSFAPPPQVSVPLAKHPQMMSPALKVCVG